MKRISREQAETKKQQAAALMERIGEPERADEFRDMTVEEYVEGRGNLELTNPTRRQSMARKTIDDYRAEIADLKEEVRDLEIRNEELEDRLDSIVDIASEEESDQERDEEDDEDEP